MHLLIVGSIDKLPRSLLLPLMDEKSKAFHRIVVADGERTRQEMTAMEALMKKEVSKAKLSRKDLYAILKDRLRCTASSL